MTIRTTAGTYTVNEEHPLLLERTADRGVNRLTNYDEARGNS